VYNRPAAALSNESKLGQAARILKAGLAFPPTLVTTDPAAARDFLAVHGDVIVKGLSGERTIVRRFRSGDAETWDRVASCPTMLQQYIPGRDVRVHIVGNGAFAHEICSAAVDYRYGARHGLRTTMAQGQVPMTILRRCGQLARALQLPLAGVDLRAAQGGEWYCFEVNPSPAFAYYERHLRLGISEAVASLLLGSA
jgi:glutathione synthase/RimK-type ligase-like ATP-grasp enzyme